jgi:CheY-like chemotaxis protein
MRRPYHSNQYAILNISTDPRPDCAPHHDHLVGVAIRQLVPRELRPHRYVWRISIELTKPVFCFVINDDHPWLPRYVETDPGKSKLFALKERIRLKVVTDTFGSPEDLAYKVSGALGRFLITARVKQDLDRLPGRDTVSTEQGRFQVARRAARLREIIDGARILLVNDLPRDVSHVIELMRDLSLNVEVCVSSEQALESLATGKFDVVISDMVRTAVEDEGPRFLSRMRARDSGRR